MLAICPDIPLTSCHLPLQAARGGTSARLFFYLLLKPLII